MLWRRARGKGWVGHETQTSSIKERAKLRYSRTAEKNPPSGILDELGTKENELLQRE